MKALIRPLHSVPIPVEHDNGRDRRAWTTQPLHQHKIKSNT